MNTLDLERIIAHLPEPIYWTDKKGVLLGCNIAEAKLFGLSPQEIIGKTIYCICELLGWDKAIADALHNNDKQVLATGKAVTVEERMPLSNGKEIIFRTHKAPLFDENKNIIGVIGNSIDITEQLTLEKELKRLKAEAQEKSRLSDIYLENILNNLPEPIYWMDTHSIILGCNKAELKLFGFKSSEEMVGKSIYDFANLLGWDKKIADKLRENDQQVMQTRISHVIEETILSLDDGKLKAFLSHKAPLYDDQGNVIGIIGTSIDITERKATEEREKIAIATSVEAQTRAEIEFGIRKAISILAGGMAHDIRSPLATIGLTGSAIRKHLPNLVEAYRLAKEANLPVPAFISNSQIEALRNLADTFEQVVKDIDHFITLTLTTIKGTDLGHTEPHNFTLCNTDKCISNVLERHFFLKIKRELVVWNRENGFNFLGDTVQFLRILFNIFQNALYQIEKNNRGQIFISSENKGDFNILRIRDTAGGASPEIVKHMFESYRTTKKDGTGVGLAACKLTMKSFNGDITCHSVEGDYMEFVLSFPEVTHFEKALLHN